MKTLKTTFKTLFILALAAVSVTSCKKGEDDPVISLRSREDRFVNEWTLNKLEKNGTAENIDGSTYIYESFKDGTLKETIEGSVFGVATRTIKSGTWRFVDDKEQVRISIDSNVTTYDVQRLADKELWLKKYEGEDTYIYYFSGSK